MGFYIQEWPMTTVKNAPCVFKNSLQLNVLKECTTTDRKNDHNTLIMGKKIPHCTESGKQHQNIFTWFVTDQSMKSMYFLGQFSWHHFRKRNSSTLNVYKSMIHPGFKCIVLNILKIPSVQFSCLVMSDSLRSHGLQHTRLPCPSTTPKACSNTFP